MVDRALVYAASPVLEGVLRMSAGVVATSVVGTTDLSVLRQPRDPAPDLIVVDVDPGGSAPFRDLRRAAPLATLVIVSERADGPAVLDALRLDASGYLVKPEALRDLGRSLRRIVDGERLITPGLQRAAAGALGPLVHRTRDGAAIDALVTAREREILVLLGEGATMRQIGRQLGISPRTVESHAAKLYRKLGARSRVHAVGRAAALGMIDLR
jgi:two-component system nitrate/nitrite response regulator NarL